MNATTHLAEVWLTLATQTGPLPDEHAVVEAARAASLDPDSLPSTDSASAKDVRVAARTVVIVYDDGETLPAELGAALGACWAKTHGARQVRWDANLGTLVNLADGSVVIPWRSHVVWPFPTATQPMATAMRALARLSGNTLVAINDGLSAVTMAEEHQPEQVADCARVLTVLRHAAKVVTVSDAAAIEYIGWKRTLAAIGLKGPTVLRTDPAPGTTCGALTAGFAERLQVGVAPLVVVFGNASPRHHELVLRGAMQAWDEGALFALTILVQSSSGQAGCVSIPNRVAESQASGRPLDLVYDVTASDIRWALTKADLAITTSPPASAALEICEAAAAGTPILIRRGSGTAPLAGRTFEYIDSADSIHQAIANHLHGGVGDPPVTDTRATSLHRFADAVWEAVGFSGSVAATTSQPSSPTVTTP